MSTDAVVVAATASSRVEAELICGYLRDHGIEAIFSADDEAALNPALQLTRSVRVLVRARQAAQARKLLAQAHAFE